MVQARRFFLFLFSSRSQGILKGLLMSNISYKPSPGISYDPSEKKYWDPEMLKMEIDRAFEVCHGCRMCFKYCDSFPTLFDALDNKHDGDVRKITKEETDTIMNQCLSLIHI